MEIVTTNIAVAALFSLLVFMLILSAYLYWRLRTLNTRFSDVLDIDAEVKRLQAQATEAQNDVKSLRDKYITKKEVFDSLVETIAVFDEEVELAEWGFYKPHFDYGTSDQFKSAIKDIKDKQKVMVKNKTAVVCYTDWVVQGKKSEGRKMTNRAIKLTLRAFNNECDAAIANIRWNNAIAMEKRVKTAFDTINKLNEPQDIHITLAYWLLKLDELRLTHEYREKKHAEKEEQRELRRQEREQKKLLQEMEEAVKQEAVCSSSLEKARAEAAKASGEKLNELEREIERLRFELEAAHEKAERAKSMAQQTKRGHVYIISNIGSFGEHIYKIGMTRRLDPDERVKELGDASVPFGFDVHAMIYTEDAPALEADLHRAFEDRRINKVNTRREFFKVHLDEIRTKVEELVPSAEFIETVEARQYRESESLRRQAEESPVKDIRSQYPAEL